jgi:hypothetical protein
MYGLDKDNDLSFFLEKQLEQVCFGWVSINLNFDGDITLSLECTFEHVTKHGQVFLGDSSEPISCSSLLTLLASSVKRVDNIGEGSIELFFSNGDKVRIYDSNDSTESYNITFPKGRIVV